MSTVSFPITLTGSYFTPNICKASDYRDDFGKLRDAVNQMYGSHSTLIFTGIESTYQDNAWVYEPAWGDGATSGGAFGVGSGGVDTPNGADYKILNVIKVPAWARALRVRGLQVCNFSRLPNGSTSSWDTDAVTYLPDATNPLRFGVAYGDIEDLEPDNWSATDAVNIALDTEPKVRGPYQSFVGARINTNSSFADGAGFHKQSSNTVVPPGKYLAIYVTGLVYFLDVSSPVKAYDLNWHFAVNAVCDAMPAVL